MKKHIVCLTDEERKLCDETIDRLTGSSQKARRARILRQVDVDGPGWQDQAVAEAYGCRVQTVQNVRNWCVLEGFERALEGRQRDPAIRPNLLDGRQEAELIALRLGVPPPGYCSWSLRLLARQVVEFGIAETISHETVNRTLKKRDSRAQAAVLGDAAAGGRGIRSRAGGGSEHVRAGVRSGLAAAVHGRAAGAAGAGAGGGNASPPGRSGW